MSVCERCTENGNCAWQNHDETICREKPAFPITNADRIRAMTDEELAEFFTQGYYDGPKFYCPVQPVIGEGECAMRSDCRQCWLDWLKKEVDDGNT